MQNNKKIFVIDGNSLLFRAFFATSMGDTTNIILWIVLLVTGGIFAGSFWYAKKQMEKEKDMDTGKE